MIQLKSNAIPWHNILKNIKRCNFVNKIFNKHSSILKYLVYFRTLFNHEYLNYFAFNIIYFYTLNSNNLQPIPKWLKTALKAKYFIPVSCQNFGSDLLKKVSLNCNICICNSEISTWFHFLYIVSYSLKTIALQTIRETLINEKQN